MRRNDQARMRKAQISLFIIMGVILLIAVGSLMYFIAQSKSIGDEEEFIELEFSPVKQYVDSCVESTLTIATYYLSEQGGYIYSYDNILPTEKKNVAYHLMIDNDAYPTKAFMEAEISKFISENIGLCIKNFETFDNFQINSSTSIVVSKINDQSVSVQMTYPLKIMSGDKVATISTFKSSIPVRLGYILGVKDKIIEKEKASSFNDLSFLASQDLEITILPYDMKNIIYHIRDPKSDVDGKAFEFYFAVERPFVIVPVPEMTLNDYYLASVGEPFYLKVNASSHSKNILYEDDTALFNIDPVTGEIILTPTPDQAGNYMVTITADDGGSKSKEQFTLRIS